MELPFPELTIGDRLIPLRGSAFLLEAALAAGAADSLEIAVGAEGIPAFPAEVGEPAVLRLQGVERFRGIVERTSVRCQGEEGPVAEIGARSGWVARARALPGEEEYREVTDSEVAARLADELGLEASIDPTGLVHRRLARRGDPIDFLFQRARAAGRLSAIAAGKLHFSIALPAGPVHEIGPSAPVLAFRASRRSGGRTGGRYGTVVLASEDGISPLDRLRLPGLGAACAGLLRVARVGIRMGPLGFSVEVSWVEDGADLALAAEDVAWGLPPAALGAGGWNPGWAEAAG